MRLKDLLIVMKMYNIWAVKVKRERVARSMIKIIIKAVAFSDSLAELIKRIKTNRPINKNGTK